MTTELQNEYLKLFDKNIRDFTNEKVLLIMDNAPCHALLSTTKLKQTKVVFLPPNCTSVFQPMDQGIIRTTKVLYRAGLVRHILQARETNTKANVSIADAIILVDEAWKRTTPTAIKNYSRKAGFY